jgi:hypothetical protein
MRRTHVVMSLLLGGLAGPACGLEVRDRDAHEERDGGAERSDPKSDPEGTDGGSGARAGEKGASDNSPDSLGTDGGVGQPAADQSEPEPSTANVDGDGPNGDQADAELATDTRVSGEDGATDHDAATAQGEGTIDSSSGMGGTSGRGGMGAAGDGTLAGDSGEAAGGADAAGGAGGHGETSADEVSATGCLPACIRDLQLDCTPSGACISDSTTGDLCWDNGVAFGSELDISDDLTSVIVDSTWTTTSWDVCYTTVGTSGADGSTVAYEWYAADGTTPVATGTTDAADSSLMEVTCVGESAVVVDLDSPNCEGTEDGTNPDVSACDPGTCD